MSSDPVDIAKIRELEASVKNDKKKSNFILDIKKYLSNEKNSQKVRLASMHALRRIFIEILDNNLLTPITSNDKEAVLEYKRWIKNQLKSFLELLNLIILTEVLEIQVAAIRTIFEVNLHNIVIN